MSSRRLAVWVRPGAQRPGVGGVREDGTSSLLIVAVRERAVDGAATEAVLAAVAGAVGVKRGQVHLVSGFTSRAKILEIDQVPPDFDVRIDALRGQ